METLSLKRKPQLQIDLVTKNNLGQVQAIVEAFGNQSIVDIETFRARLVYFQDIPVGTISTQQLNETVVIKEFYVLKAYQSYGCGTLMLNDMLEHYRAIEGTLLEPKPTRVEIVVGDDVVSWFEHVGFERGEQQDLGITMSLLL